MLHEDYKELLLAHALTAVDAVDARALEAHLEICPECRAQLSEWQDTAAVLTLAAKPLEPTPALRSRILKTVRTDSTRQSRAKEDVARNPAETSSVIGLWRRERKSWASAPAWGAMAAGLVFVVLLLSLFVLWRENNAARQELGRLSRQVRDAQQQLERQREAIEIVATPGTRMTELAGTSIVPGAHAMLAYDRSGRAILLAKGLPPAPAGKAYQLWFISAGRPMPGKVFFPDASGAGTLTDQVPTEALNAAVFAITLEPESGVRAPTGAIYLSSGS